MSSSSLLVAVRPGGRFVVEGACLQTAVQDAHEPVGQLAQGSVVLGTACAELVVVGAGAGRGGQRGECLGHQRVDKPVVVHEPGPGQPSSSRRHG